MLQRSSERLVLSVGRWDFRKSTEYRHGAIWAIIVDTRLFARAESTIKRSFWQLPTAAIVAIVLIASAFTACSGGASVQGERGLLQLKTPLETPTPSHESDQLTIPLVAGTALPMPPLGGFSGTFTEAANSAPAGTTISLTSYDRPPAAAPAVQGGAIALFWVSNTYSAAATFNGLPSVTTWTLPVGFSTAQEGFSLETFDGTTGSLLDYHVASLSGRTLSIPGTSTVSEIPSHTYWWELLCAGTNPTNVPYSQAGQSTTLLPVCGFTNTVATISPNNAPSGAYLDFSAVVPIYYSGLSAPPGTTTGLMSIDIGNVNSNLPQAVTYNSGLLAFSAVVPAAIPTQGKSFHVTACTYNLVWTSGTNSRSGCIDTPYTSGPLTVSGQTISFAGIPFPITLPAMTGTDCAGLADCVWSRYVVQVYY